MTCALNYNNDDTTYELGSAEYFQTIWDTGGNDEILVISDAGSVVDLRPATLKYEIGGAGYVSYAYDLRGGHTIAANTIIENVVGGDGNDQITGNHVSNNLFGRLFPDYDKAGFEFDVTYIFPLILGIFMLFRLSKKYDWLSRISIAYIVGMMAGLKFYVFLNSNLLTQIKSSTVNPLSNSIIIVYN